MSHDDGMRTRREVLGDEHVDRAIANTDAFTADFQDLITRYAWDEIWNRPGLDRRSRSLLNLGMIAALNRPHELRLHVRGALNNGLTREELREVFLQIAAYCGFPAALDALRVATETLAEIDGKG
jgi:4-carboxymuconolactone decarboxylase